MTKPRVFIGGAAESDDLVAELSEGLADVAEVWSWRDVFRLSDYTLQALQRAANQVDFAVLVFGRDDVTTSRKKQASSPRDNVVYEAGLFAGNLGEYRTFIVHALDTKIPTDHLGVTMARYDGDDPDLSDAVREIRKRVGELGARLAHRISGPWWQLVPATGEGSVVSFVELIPVDGRNVELRGQAWDPDGRRRSSYRSVAAQLSEQKLTLRYYWEGEHSMEAGLPRFFGVGEILFDREPVTGSFSSTSRSPEGLAKPTYLRSAWYFRAPPEHVAILEGQDRDARERLIREQLARREDLWL
jgi:hypothetical protein